MDTKLQDDGFPLGVAEPTAEWHVPEDDEDFVRFTPLSSIWLRVIAWFFLCTGFFAFAFVSKFVENSVSHYVAISEALVLVLLSEAVLIYLYRKISSHIDIGMGFKRLRSKVPEDVDLPVRIEVRRFGSLTGRDEGFMWLKDGTWYFKGIQTAFRFNQQDIVPIEAWPKKIKPDPANDKPPKTVPMKSSSGPLELDLLVINPYEDFAKRKRAKKFYRELYNWLCDRPRGSIESLLPPLRVHPNLFRTGISKYEGVVAGLAMVGLNSAVLLSLPKQVSLESTRGSFALLVAVVVGVLLFGAFRLAWLESRDLAVRAKLQDQNLP